MMGTILVAGRSGQVAQSLIEAGKGRSGLKIVALGRPDLDITDADGIAHVMDAVKPDLVVNAAAYTAVDQAETDRDAAYAGNEVGPRRLGEASAARSLPVIHLSTDYVFGGDGDRPYQPEDETSPLGVYGASKLAGEKALAEVNPRHVILRTAWVYGAHGKNFLKTMLRVGTDRDQLSVVADQKGAPTSSHDIAEGILDVAEAILAAPSDAAYGTYHMTAGGEAVWADFAEAIFAASREAGGPHAAVKRIGTEDYPTPAKRPAYSVLDSSALAEAFGVRLPHWQEPVPGIVARVLKETN
ncbi:MAG: dTDP-4-dehydrorhamnose reductase [Parvularcula sp.]|jgi:dTDP-4-dehydrorhamnose reductase|nr:dTDP-4-dehydrorhamnose reductase [Parvularcula sp.]